MRSATTHILGLGVTGYSCLRFLHGQAELRVFDTRTAPPFLEAARREYPDVEVTCGAVDPDALGRAERIVVSPGIALDSCVLRVARRRGVPLVSDVGLFLDAVRAPVIGITGTNGKSTVTALAGELLRAAGGDPGVGGNIGRPALDLLDARHDVFVLELSSFQLDALGAQTLDTGVLLNVTPDHLDRYGDFASYAASKQRVFAGARLAIFNRDDPRTHPGVTNDLQVSIGLGAPEAGHWGIVDHRGERYLSASGTLLLPVSALALRGRHNQANALAALAVVAGAGYEVSECLDALAGFKGLEHRCQTVCEADGITYINDSKATNPGAAAAALDGLAGTAPNILLIAGGDAKGAALDELVRAADGRVKAALVLGRDAERVAAALAPVVPVQRVADLEEAVDAARRAAIAGDIVLLSPACASLDMFASFEARGAAFVTAVEKAVRR